MEQKIAIFIKPILCLIFIIVFGFLSYNPIMESIQGINSNKELIKKNADLTQELEMLRKNKEQEKSIEIEGSKVIYENSEFRFSKDASFAPLIEKFIDISKISGVRIHAIDYNYTPADDPVFVAQYAGYNVCELSVTAAGRYNNFQRLFETIVADANIMNLSEIDITPWASDNSVLVGKFKLRLYTKTM